MNTNNIPGYEQYCDNCMSESMHNYEIHNPLYFYYQLSLFLLCFLLLFIIMYETF